MDLIALLAALCVAGAIVVGMFAFYQSSAMPRAGLTRRLGAILGDGWYRRVSFMTEGKRNNGKPLALLMQLEVTYESGQTETIVSDDQWKTATGPILLSELYNGEVYDARLEHPGARSGRPHRDRCAAGR